MKSEFILMKKCLALFIISSIFLTGCGADKNKTNEGQGVEETNKVAGDDRNGDIQDKEPDRPNEEELKVTIEENIGTTDEVVSMKIEGNDIFIEVKLGDMGSATQEEHMVFNRYSSITDALLENPYWENIAVNFIGIGNVSMNSSQSKENGFGKYFDSLDIEDNLKVDVGVEKNNLHGGKPNIEKLSRKDEIEKGIKSRVDDGEYKNSKLEKIVINENLGTDIENDYVALVYLKFNIKNRKDTGNKLMKMYSDDLVATLAKQGTEDVVEAVIFWKDEYNDRTVKYAYEYKNGGFYITDISGE